MKGRQSKWDLITAPVYYCSISSNSNFSPHQLRDNGQIFHKYERNFTNFSSYFHSLSHKLFLENNFTAYHSPAQPKSGCRILYTAFTTWVSSNTPPYSSTVVKVYSSTGPLAQLLSASPPCITIPKSRSKYLFHLSNIFYPSLSNHCIKYSKMYPTNFADSITW